MRTVSCLMLQYHCCSVLPASIQYLFIHPYIYLYVYIHEAQSSIYLYSSIHISVYMYISMKHNLSIYLSISIHPSIYLSICIYPWSTVLPEKLTVPQPVKKFKCPPVSQSSARWLQSTTPSTSLRSILILYPSTARSSKCDLFIYGLPTTPL